MISISHNDLDGFSCSMLVKRKFISIAEKTNRNLNISEFNINYDQISEVLFGVDEMFIHNENECDSHVPKTNRLLVITDLSFKLDDMKTLYRIVKKHGFHLFYIDHHEYDSKTMLVLNKLRELPNVVVSHDESTSATLLTYNLFGIDSIDTNGKILQFCKVVDAFDSWKRTKEPALFKIGVDLNNVFWDLKGKRFVYEFRDFNLNSDIFKNTAKSLRNKIHSHFSALEEKSLSFEDSGIRIIFTDDFNGMVNLIYPQNVVILATSNAKFSLRLGDSVSKENASYIKKTVLEKCTDSPFFLSGGGHTHAFAVKFNESMENNFEMTLEATKDIFNIFLGLKEFWE